MSPISQANIAVVEQLQQLLSRLDDEQYVTVSALSHSPVGRHVRHVLDHYRAFFAGLKVGKVDYRQRQRNNDEETQRQLALDSTQQILVQLTKNLISEQALIIIDEVSVQQSQTVTTESTAGRELKYLVDHTVHHVAYAVFIARSLGAELDEALGVAPSTLSYMRNG